MNNYQPPLFVIGAEPNQKLVLDNFFFEDNNPLFDLLRNPPYLRYMGWNLRTLDKPKITDGKCWEVKNGERKTIRLYRDGAFIAIAWADNSFLGWGQDYDKFLKNPKLNTLAVIEYVYEFVELFRLLAKHYPSLSEITFQLGIKNLALWEGKKLILTTQKITQLPNFDYFTEKGEIVKDFYTDKQIIKIDGLELYDSRYIVFNLLSELFIRFNIPNNKIPYIKFDEKNIGYVDIDEIKSIV